jgi:hypothetical protein
MFNWRARSRLARQAHPGGERSAFNLGADVADKLAIDRLFTISIQRNNKIGIDHYTNSVKGFLLRLVTIIVSDHARADQ